MTATSPPLNKPLPSNHERFKHCQGCDQHFYNGRQNFNSTECWSRKNAKMVRRWAIGWWTQMDRKENFTKVRVYNCRTERSKRAFLKRLPQHLGGAEA